MQLSISTTYQPASDLGFLLYKHPQKFQTFKLNQGEAHVFYPEVSDERCTAVLLLELDPVGLVRSQKSDSESLLTQYVNDRPFVASSFMSTAIAQVFRNAMQGECKERPELVKQAIPLEVTIDVLPVRGGGNKIADIFSPLGYRVDYEQLPLDEQFPEWGMSHYYRVNLSHTIRLSELLTHLYVLIPVFDNFKHYFVGAAELEKLLSRGKGWLERHPEKAWITRRYLKFKANLYQEAISRLIPDDVILDDDNIPQQIEEEVEQKIRLHDQRLHLIVDHLKNMGVKRVLDLGCGEGKLLKLLLADKQFEKITGVDISHRSLQIASKRMNFDTLPEHKKQRIELMQGSAIYRDAQFINQDAITLVEVIEHLEPNRLPALARVVFEFAKPKHVLISTPNREYNKVWENLPENKFRHGDHRFEWTREEFQQWANDVASKFGYAVEFKPVGGLHEEYGAPTQLGIFTAI